MSYTRIQGPNDKNVKEGGGPLILFTHKRQTQIGIVAALLTAYRNFFLLLLWS